MIPNTIAGYRASGYVEQQCGIYARQLKNRTRDEFLKAPFSTHVYKF
jgi:hypothetical protein